MEQGNDVIHFPHERDFWGNLSGTWDSVNPVFMTQNEFEMAKAKGDENWLYIVERATSEDIHIYRIQNPAKPTTFCTIMAGNLYLLNKD
jgi:hypothetical protein